MGPNPIQPVSLYQEEIRVERQMGTEGRHREDTQGENGHVTEVRESQGGLQTLGARRGQRGHP